MSFKQEISFIGFTATQRKNWHPHNIYDEFMIIRVKTGVVEHDYLIDYNDSNENHKFKSAIELIKNSNELYFKNGNISLTHELKKKLINEIKLAERIYNNKS